MTCRMPPMTLAFAGDSGFYVRPSETELDVVTAEGKPTAAYRLPAEAKILLPGLPFWR